MHKTFIALFCVLEEQTKRNPRLQMENLGSSMHSNETVKLCSFVKAVEHNETLPAHEGIKLGAGYGNRTRAVSLEG